MELGRADIKTRGKAVQMYRRRAGLRHLLDLRQTRSATSTLRTKHSRGQQFDESTLHVVLCHWCSPAGESVVQASLGLFVVPQSVAALTEKVPDAHSLQGIPFGFVSGH